jgi:hypothetical protein
MATASSFPWFDIQFFVEGPDGTWIPAEGHKLRQYAAGTTNNTDTFTDKGGSTPNAHPILLDEEGRCTMFGTPGTLYDFVLIDADDAQVKVYEDIEPNPIDSAGDFVEKAGDTMEGPLVLEADPTEALGAATKQYVDGAVVEAINSIQSIVDTAQEAAAAAIKQGAYMVASASGGSATLDVVDPTLGVYLIVLYTAASHPTPSATGWNITVTQAASFGATSVGTSFAMQKSASDTQSTYGSAIAVGTLTISTTGTYTLSMSAASLGGLTGRGSWLVAIRQP